MIVPRQDVRRAAGHSILLGFEGGAVSAELKELLRETRPAGLLLSERNIASPAAVAELSAEIKALRPADPLLICVDQEGGRVARIRAPATEWPPMRELGRVGDSDLVRRFAAAVGMQLRAMNIDVNLAPVLDVDTNADNPVIGDRAFSPDPDLTASLGAAFIDGLHASGVAACGKHFPGHGDTDADSHAELPRLAADIERLRAVEWPPFRAAVRAGVGAVMTAHVVVEALDETLPATLSGAALAPLRDELGFGGVIVSDDLQMRAVADHTTPAQMAVLGINAGVDLLLVSRDPAFAIELYRGIVQGIEREEIQQTRLLEAGARVLAWQQRFYQPPATPRRLDDVLDSVAVANLRDEIQTRASQSR
jgi:beta-N-acetylhexosaminidase